MAQYFHVLSQTDKPTGSEIQQFYPANIVDNQTTVQYVIGSNDQDFQTQQILVSSDQVMLVDGQPQQIIVDQTPVPIQNQQYIIQDTNVEFQEAPQQQIFYVDESNQVQRVESMSDGARPTQPVVLNHLQTTPVHAQLAGVKTVLNTQRPITINNLQQSPTVLVPQRQIQVPSVRQPNFVVQTPAQSVRPKLHQLNQGVATNRVKQPLIRYNSASEVNSEKKFPPTSVNPQTHAMDKSDLEQKKRQIRATAPRARPLMRPNLYQQQSRFNRPIRGTAPHVSPQQQSVIHRQLQSPQHQVSSTPTHNPNYIIHSHGTTPPVGEVPVFQPTLQLKQIIESTPIDDEYRDSIRMLIILSTGEQRLITFTLPKEQCTITEILEQVGLPIHSDTIINCTETYLKEIHYVVNVTYGTDNTNSSVMTTVQVEQPETPSSVTPSPPLQVIDTPTSESSTQRSESPESPVFEPPKELPKIIPGKLAVCTHCGYLSEDFNKCTRCKTKLPVDVKVRLLSDQIPVSAVHKKIEIKSGNDKKNLKTANGTAGGIKKTRSKSKLVEQEPIILTLSSDEEEDESKAMTTLKLSEPHTLIEDICRKEPSLTEYQLTDQNSKNHVREDPSTCVTTSIYCRTIRIGSYRFVPAENNILISSNEVIMKVPHPANPTELKTVKIDRSKIVKVLANFQKALPVIFYYVSPMMGAQIRNILGMEKGSEYYFDPISKQEAFKRITILPEHFGDEAKVVFKQIYGKPPLTMEELNAKEANSILVKTCPKEISKNLPSSIGAFTEIKQLLIYPPEGKGGLSINTEDYLCLAQDQFLNDVIIDFYLKYIVMQFPEEQQQKIHIFSTFFYKRLTTKPLKATRRMNPAEMDANLSAAQKRHVRVKNWTKNVNIFEKDFIIIPINENCHWFLAIICFPGMEGCHTMDGKPYKLEPKQKSQQKKKLSSMGNVTITQIKMEKGDSPICDGELSDKDEAEGDESELESEEEIEEPKPSGVVPPLKQPCILIFDSLAAGTSRSRVVATLRDYLSCEYLTKMNIEKTFNKDNIKCSCPKVPQQTNFTDCGLYLLQYVESFFETPIKSYQFPIRELKTWFEEMTVTRKREDIAKLIEQLMIQYNKDPGILPEIQLPTLNGKLTNIRLEDELEEEEEEEHDENENDDEDHISESTVLIKSSDYESFENAEISCDDAISPSQSNLENMDFSSTPIAANDVKPDVPDAKKTSNRDTLSYLKAKRIIRHKNNDGQEVKKFKSDIS
nr:uncharacterized protein LOC111427716 [Onthophagus taurus]